MFSLVVLWHALVQEVAVAASTQTDRQTDRQANRQTQTQTEGDATQRATRRLLSALASKACFASTTRLTEGKKPRAKGWNGVCVCV
jgi:hypothetical protein